MSADIPTDPTGAAAPRAIPACLLLQVAARQAQQLDVQACCETSLRPPLLGVLIVVEQQPGIRQGLCAELLGFDATTFGRYVERLATDGLLLRDVRQGDRRVVCLTLTEAGAAAVARCRPMLAQMETEAKALLGGRSWEELSRLLLRYLEAYDHPLPMWGTD